MTKQYVPTTPCSRRRRSWRGSWSGSSPDGAPPRQRARGSGRWRRGRGGGEQGHHGLAEPLAVDGVDADEPDPETSGPGGADLAHLDVDRRLVLRLEAAAHQLPHWG